MMMMIRRSTVVLLLFSVSSFLLCGLFLNSSSSQEPSSQQPTTAITPARAVADDADDADSDDASFSSSHDRFALAKHESLGFFDDIDEATWRLYQQKARRQAIYSNPSNPNFRLKQSPQVWMLNNVDPIFTCPHLERVGGRGDGPKWTCDPHRLRKQQIRLFGLFRGIGGAVRV